MKKVTAFVGSARKKHTYDAVSRFLGNLQSLGDVESEIVVLSDYRIGTCRGCRACFNKGEEFCPMKDDRDILIQKLASSDGVVFASPVYSFQVSAIMKIFLDRLGFMFHRPRFFGKTFTSIVTQAIYGGEKVVKYLDFCGYALGFNTVKGAWVPSLDPMTQKQERKVDAVTAILSKRFLTKLERPAYPAPTFLSLMAFRMSRTSYKLILDDSYRDYTYFAEQGWFDSDYYYPAKIGLLHKAAGRVFDSLAAGIAKHR